MRPDALHIPIAHHHALTRIASMHVSIENVAVVINVRIGDEAPTIVPRHSLLNFEPRVWPYI
ncbi:hypothetical protein BOMU111920_03225 [Bordetella muralis]|jgi:hypothetical protein